MAIAIFGRYPCLAMYLDGVLSSMDAVAKPCSGRLENYQQEKIFLCHTLACGGNFPRQPQFVGFCYN